MASPVAQGGASKNACLEREPHHIFATIWQPALVALVLHLFLVIVYLGKHDRDPSALVCAGASRVGQPPYELIARGLGPSGEDGQFYYSLARSPWRPHGEDIDLPPYRHLRILYPATCWLCTGGHPWLLFYVMPGINLLAIAGLAGLGAALAQFYGRNVWWGLLLPFAVNSGTSLLHNFTDCLSNFAVFGLVAAWLMQARWPALIAWAAAAVFAREQNLAIVAGVAIAAIGTGQFKLAAGLAAVVGAWCAWAGILWAAYGQSPLLFGGGNFQAPLTGLYYRWTHLGYNGDDHFSRRLAILHFLSSLQLSLLIPVGIYAGLRSPSRVVGGMLLLGVLLAVMGGSGIYVGFNSYTRVFAWIPAGIWLATLATPARWPLLMLAPGALWSLVVALGFV
jgi:hypothetical protein